MKTVNWDRYSPNPIALLLWSDRDYTVIAKLDVSGDLHGCRTVARTAENHDECVEAWIANECGERGLKLHDMRAA